MINISSNCNFSFPLCSLWQKYYVVLRRQECFLIKNPLTTNLWASMSKCGLLIWFFTPFHLNAFLWQACFLYMFVCLEKNNFVLLLKDLEFHRSTCHNWDSEQNAWRYIVQTNCRCYWFSLTTATCRFTLISIHGMYRHITCRMRNYNSSGKRVDNIL